MNFLKNLNRLASYDSIQKTERSRARKGRVSGVNSSTNWINSSCLPSFVRFLRIEKQFSFQSDFSPKIRLGESKLYPFIVSVVTTLQDYTQSF